MSVPDSRSPKAQFQVEASLVIGDLKKAILEKLSELFELEGSSGAVAFQLESDSKNIYVAHVRKGHVTLISYLNITNLLNAEENV